MNFNYHYNKYLIFVAIAEANPRSLRGEKAYVYNTVGIHRWYKPNLVKTKENVTTVYLLTNILMNYVTYVSTRI